MSDAGQKIAARLAVLWQSSRPAILERLATLQSAYETLRRNPAELEARQNGREAAHKLAGILGVFGLPQGSETASVLEDLLKHQDPLTPEDLTTLHSRILELSSVIASKPEPLL